MNTKNLSQKRALAAFCLCFVFFVFIMWCTPFASDDFEFASMELHTFSEIMDHALYYGNGRLLGNVGVMYLVNAPMLGVVVKAFVITSIIFLLPAVLGISGRTGYLAAFLLLTIIEPELFGQVYTWTSGFQNYLPSVWLTLVVVYLIQKYPKNSVLRALSCGGIFLLGVSSQLFVEHSSIANFLLAALFVISAKKEEKLPRWVWLASTVVGLGLMFLIPQVFQMAGNRSEGYRSFNLDSIRSLILSCNHGLATLVSYYSPITAVVASLCAIMAVRMTKEHREEKTNTLWYRICVICMAFMAFNGFLTDNVWAGSFTSIRRLLSLAFIAPPYVIWALAMWNFPCHQTRSQVLAMLGLAAFTMAPLLVVSPIPMRVVYQSHVFFAAAALLMLDRFLPTLADRWKKQIPFLLQAGAGCFALLLCLTFFNVRWLANVREEYILRKMEEGAATITVFEIPYDYVYWDDTWCFSRGYFYEEWDDIEFIETDFDTWNTVYYKGGA